MDNGEVIPGLNEDWTFCGAKMFEWIAGFMMLILASEFLVEKPAKQAPILVCIMIGTTLGLALCRRSFADEERGMRNACMTALGMAPPGIPAPAFIQPVWSGAPLREMDEKLQFMELGLDKVFPQRPDDDDDDNPLVI